MGTWACLRCVPWGHSPCYSCWVLDKNLEQGQESQSAELEEGGNLSHFTITFLPGAVWAQSSCALLHGLQAADGLRWAVRFRLSQTMHEAWHPYWLPSARAWEKPWMTRPSSLRKISKLLQGTSRLNGMDFQKTSQPGSPGRPPRKRWAVWLFAVNQPAASKVFLTGPVQLCFIFPYGLARAPSLKQTQLPQLVWTQNKLAMEYIKSERPHGAIYTSLDCFQDPRLYCKCKWRTLTAQSVAVTGTCSTTIPHAPFSSAFHGHIFTIFPPWKVNCV